VEGTGSGNTDTTSHDFTSMAGIESVIIATDGNGGTGDSTTLIDLEADQDVSISGKNQTIGNNSTNSQLFNTVVLTDDDGAERTVTLDNTARLSNPADSTAATAQTGILTVAQLDVNSGVGGSATRDLTIDSSGARNVANSVNAFNGRDVVSLSLTGTQELTFNVNQIADQAAATGVTASTALDIDASDLTGDLNLAVNGNMIGNWGTATGLTDRIVGTDGDNDTLMVYGAQTSDAVNVSEIETVQFGSAVTTLFGDWATSQSATGTFDAQNVSANNFVISDSVAGVATLQLDNLGSGSTVNMGDANTTSTGGTVNSQIFDNVITLNSGAAAGTPAATLDVNYLSNVVGGQALDLNIGTVVAGTGNDTGGYQSVNIDVAHAGNLTGVGGVSTAADSRTLNLTLTEDVRELNLSGGADNSGFRDSLTFSTADELPNSLTRVDLSGYEGDVTLTMEQGQPLAAAAETDVRFVMSEDNATITLSDKDGSLAAGTGVSHNSIFEFTEAKTTTDISEWNITNFVGAGQGASSIDNITRFDISDLGITAFDQVVIDTAVDANGVALGAGIYSIRSEAQDDASTNTGTNQNTWEIQVTGVVGLAVAGDITEDNFIF
jgi:hypothetical protein